jgi:organic radical activating enzyme
MPNTQVSVREAFYAIQGEGSRSGEATVFLRLAGCNLDCWFCDTDWQHGDRFELAQIPELLARVSHPFTPQWVTISGGEPCVAPAFDALVAELKKSSWWVSVETNGTHYRHSLDFCHVVVSPKEWWEPKGRVDPELQKVAELKLIVEADTTLPMVNELRASMPFKADYNYLQPLYEHREAWRRAFELVREDPSWRLSLQMHKWLRVR